MNYASTSNIREVIKFYNLSHVTKLLKQTSVIWIEKVFVPDCHESDSKMSTREINLKENSADSKYIDKHRPGTSLMAIKDL